ncbi:MAG: anthranilate phosphoribosyltransferase [Gammaproteobacteria bacterium]|nr:anthranilate phosphoribosyltransferase [Gammaproteobacteria bacterium]MDE1983891.1 anthranilate phosphoribosyltransferase [Gammaproteobacteria bacterium]MDE2109262.1 anthranilate phosphoribosyltransferase [Gammaproteobacteria bacterium]MDE2462078.1 anthranilate phosphoribosyltransferase [Gammaproteobacteria bacterium]
MEIKEAISHIVDREDLSRADMEAVMRQIMTGGATPIQIGGFLAGLRAKGETVEEITAAATVMRELAVHVEVSPEHLVDTCGTGGDGARLFNVSTAAALVVAAAGGRVAKHGNRAMSGNTGSADVLEALGVQLDLPPERIARCVDQVGVGFLYAPAHHSATRYAAAPRKELGTRTLFNLLGPLTNPAGAPHQLLGVFAPRWVEPLAKVLRALGSRHVLVVHSEDGLDEISVAAPTRVAELQGEQIRSYAVRPGDFGIAHASLDELRVTSVQESLALIRDALSGKAGPAFDMVALNAGAALYAADVAASLAAGVARAREVMANGAAAAKLTQLAEASR